MTVSNMVITEFDHIYNPYNAPFTVWPPLLSHSPPLLSFSSPHCILHRKKRAFNIVFLSLDCFTLYGLHFHLPFL